MARALRIIGKPFFLLTVFLLRLIIWLTTFNRWWLFAAGVFLVWLIIFRGLPSPAKLTTRNLEVSTKIYDRNGVLLYKIYKNKNRSLVKSDEITPQIKFATLAAEDAEFYSHPGFSIKGIIRALGSNIKNGKLQGGSTITQQLVKNALLSPERTVVRKIKELILAIEVELTFSKDEILVMYLNEVPYGGTAYGIKEATKAYFGKEINDINLAEAAYLSGLPKSPTRLSPYGQNPELALGRQREILKLMRINGFITNNEEEQAKNTKLALLQKKTEIKAPHFVMYVRELLEEKFGPELVGSGGLEVTTSLDYQLQASAEKVVAEEITRLKALKVTNGGAVIINPQSGEILGMVGSTNYFDLQNEGNVNTTLSLRPPGSSIKIVNYAYALGHGFTPNSILADTPVSYPQPNGQNYSPQNYDGKFRGNITLRSALAESRNIPAVKVLNSYGVNKMIEQGQKMGITTWTDPSRFGLSLTLGGGEVKLIDLARVYATVANSGRKPELISVLKVTDYKGKVLYEAAPKNEAVLDPKIADTLTDILKDNNARAPAFGLNSQLVIKNHPEVAVKTGTSNNLRDNLTIGYTKDLLVAVWVGNNDNSPMSRVASGITGASPIWNRLMSTSLQKQAVIGQETRYQL